MIPFHQMQNSVGNYAYNVRIYDDFVCGLHFHKNHEVIYVMEGEAVCSVNGRTKTLCQGDFAFCLSNEIHSIRSNGEGKIWIGVFSEDFIYAFKEYANGKTGSDFSFRCSDSVMQLLSKHLIREEISDVFLIKSCLYALCSEYLRQVTLHKSEGKHASLMGKIVEYIEKNYKKDLSLSDIAEYFGYEYVYFSRIFNRIFSMSFNDYLNVYRFNEACAMLLKTEMTVTKISEECGFKSIRSFNHVFKKLADVSPREYRKAKPDMKDTIKSFF